MNQEVQCCIHKDPPIIPILDQINSIPHINTYFFKIHSSELEEEWIHSIPVEILSCFKWVNLSLHIIYLHMFELIWMGSNLLQELYGFLNFSIVNSISKRLGSSFKATFLMNIYFPIGLTEKF